MSLRGVKRTHNAVCLPLPLLPETISRRSVENAISDAITACSATAIKEDGSWYVVERSIRNGILHFLFTVAEVDMETGTSLLTMNKLHTLFEHAMERIREGEDPVEEEGNARLSFSETKTGKMFATLSVPMPDDANLQGQTRVVPVLRIPL